MSQVQPVARWLGRAVGLDLHHDFCVIAICEEGLTYSAGRVPMNVDGLESLVASLEPTDRVVMEVSGGCGVPGRAVRFSELRAWFVAGVIPIG